MLSVFLQKTIYERSPGVARQLLLDLPLSALKVAWSKYIVAPIQSVLDFADTLGKFQAIVDELFGAFEPTGRASFAFFPSQLRTPIMQAGADRKIVRMTYDGVRRDVEPYALAYKRRKDGHREEYLYGWDLTGGRTSRQAIKALVNTKIRGLEISHEAFDPRYPIELAKAGEQSGRGYFSGTRFGSGHSTAPSPACATAGGTRSSAFIARGSSRGCGGTRLWSRTRTRTGSKARSSTSGTAWGRSTIRRILKAAGLPPVPQRPTSWQTSLNAHWGGIAGGRFLHERSLDLPGARHVLHRLRH